MRTLCRRCSDYPDGYKESTHRITHQDSLACISCIHVFLYERILFFASVHSKFLVSYHFGRQLFYPVVPATPGGFPCIIVWSGIGKFRVHKKMVHICDGFFLLLIGFTLHERDAGYIDL